MIEQLNSIEMEALAALQVSQRAKMHWKTGVPRTSARSRR